MTGDVGLGQRVLAGGRSPAAQAVAGALDGLRVNQDNVLHVHNTLKSEFYALGDLMRLYGPDLHTEPCGSDPVSEYATPAFNVRLRAFADQCNSYIQALGAAAEALAETARGYGYTEAEIAESFGTFQRHHSQSAPAAGHDGATR